MTKTINTELAIAVFAHNEAQNIATCLRSIDAALTALTLQYEIFVLNNGSTDDTDKIVEMYSYEHEHIHQELISIGDKANAWNHFIYDTGVNANNYVFIDGDVTIHPGAIQALLDCLSQHPHAHVATGVPASGMHREQQLDTLRREGGVQGNLYVAKASFIHAIREKSIKMPAGFIREDGLVGAYAMYDLNPLLNNWDTSRVAVAEKAYFRFPSLRWYSPRDIKIYWRRRQRYSLGHLQFLLLQPLVRGKGFEALPGSVDGLYVDLSTTHLKWRGADTFFDWLTLRDIRKKP